MTHWYRRMLDVGRWGRLAAAAGVLCTASATRAQVAAESLRSDQFQDISVEAGFTGSFFSWGSAWGDPDGDGLSDLFVTNHYRTKDHNKPFLYRNQGGFFERDTLAVFDSVYDMHGTGWLDVDNDGDDDFYGVTGRASRNLYLQNNGGVLEDRTLALGLGLDRSRGRTPFWWDANGDGWLDLFATNGEPLEPGHRRNVLLYREGEAFQTSLPDSLSPLGAMTSTGALLADPYGSGQAVFGVYTEGQVGWWTPGCNALEIRQQIRTKEVLAAQSADLNNDGRSDLILVRNRRGQSMAVYPYPLQFEETYDMGQINPALVNVIAGPAHGSASTESSGALRYTPMPGFIGMDSVLAHACDSFETCQKRILRFRIGLPPLPSDGATWSEELDSTIVIDVPAWWQPWQHQLSLVLNPDSTRYAGLRFQNNSDSLRLGLSKLINIPDSLIFLGSAAVHPEGTRPWVFQTSDSSLWGEPTLLLGEEDGLALSYDTALAKWSLFFSAADALTKLEAVLQSTRGMAIKATIGFTEEPEALEDQILLATTNDYGGIGAYADVSAFAGFDAPLPSTSVVAADFDNDGDVDIYWSCSLAERNQINRLYANDGQGHFALVPESGGAEGISSGASGTPSIADVDGDGFLDLFVGNGRSGGSALRGPYRLYRNRGNGNRWFRLRLEGVSSNREGIGAVVHCWTQGQQQMRVSTGGQHRMSQNERVLHFGLGLHERVDSLVLYWPSGRIQRLYDLDANQVLLVVEPDGPTWHCRRPFGLEAKEGTIAWWRFAWWGSSCAVSHTWRLMDAEGTVLETQSDLDTMLLWEDERVGEGPWFWQVRAKCPDGSLGPWSLRARIDGESIPPPLPATDQNRVFSKAAVLWRLQPNPAGASVHLVRIHEAANQNPYLVRILDLQGRPLGPRWRSPGPAIELDLGQVAPGLYFVEIQERSGVQRLPLVVQAGR